MDDLIVIDDTNFEEHIIPEGYGLIPRDYSANPIGSMASVPTWDPREIELIPRNEWSSRIKDMNQEESCLSHIRARGNNGGLIVNLDQGQSNFCWAHSATHAEMVCRAIANEPYVPLSAFAVACKIKNFANEGGWGGLSLEFATKNGIPDQSYFPQGSFNRKYDNPDTWANAAKHKVTAAWMDMTIAPYDRTLTFDQFITCLLRRIPAIGDYNWWSHSVLGLDALEFDSSLPLSDNNRWGALILNSWLNWGKNGTGALRGAKAIPNGSVAARSASPS